MIASRTTRLRVGVIYLDRHRETLAGSKLFCWRNIPITLTTPSGTSHASQRESLLELGFEWPSGRLTHCAVPLFNGEVEDCQTETLPNAPPGTPFFDLSPWAVKVSNPAARGNHVEQPGRIRLVKKHGA